MLRPWLANADISWSMQREGAGRFSLARVWFAEKPSLLLNGTSQTGPQACQTVQKVDKIECKRWIFLLLRTYGFN